MTLVEAAAFGAPSVVNGGGAVGAVKLLSEGDGCVSVDLEAMLGVGDGGGDDNYNNDDGDEGDDDNDDDDDTAVDFIRQLLASGGAGLTGHRAPLRRIAAEARSCALRWNEAACCQGLIDVLDALP